MSPLLYHPPHPTRQNGATCGTTPTRSQIWRRTLFCWQIREEEKTGRVIYAVDEKDATEKLIEYLAKGCLDIKIEIREEKGGRRGRRGGKKKKK